MMRKILAWCLIGLMLFQEAAIAGRAGLVVSNRSSTDIGIRRSRLAWENLLDGFGVYYDAIKHQDASTAVTKDGIRQINNACTIFYDAMIHLDFLRNVANSREAPYNPDPLGTAAGWPTIPTLIVGSAGVPGGSIWASSPACTTGYAGTMAAQSSQLHRVSFQVVGEPEVFDVGSDTYYNNTGNGLVRLVGATGFTKPLLNVSANAVAFNDNGVSSCVDCDSIGRVIAGLRDAGSTIADTSVLLARMRSPVEPDPVFWALGGYASNGLAVPWYYYAIALAHLDKSTGGRLIGSKPDWKPIKITLVGVGAGNRSWIPNDVYQWDGHSLQCAPPGGRCDSTYYKTSLDSLGSLRDWKGNPIPFSWGVDPDSIKPYEKFWYTKHSNFKFFPDCRTMAGSTVAANGGNTSKFLGVDVFGFRRNRVLITPERAISGAPCDGIDTTLSCLLEYARLRLDSIPEFKGRGTQGLAAPWLDYIPMGYTSDKLPPQDSLEIAMYRAGFRVAVLENMTMGSMPYAKWGASAGGNAIPTAQDPKSAVSDIREHMFKVGHGGTGSPVGTFKWVMSRWLDENPIASHWLNAHNVFVENSLGFIGRPWYFGDIPHWWHNLRSQNNVILVKPTNIGYQFNSTSNPIRPGWVQIKHTVNALNAINKAAGKTIFEFSYLGDM